MSSTDFAGKQKCQNQHVHDASNVLFWSTVIPSCVGSVTVIHSGLATVLVTLVQAFVESFVDSPIH